jgi:hypothetical protein
MGRVTRLRATCWWRIALSSSRRSDITRRGAIDTEAGTDPKMAGLVYLTAFAPDEASRSAR